MGNVQRRYSKRRRFVFIRNPFWELSVMNNAQV